MTSFLHLFTSVKACEWLGCVQKLFQPRKTTREDRRSGKYSQFFGAEDCQSRFSFLFFLEILCYFEMVRTLILYGKKLPAKRGAGSNSVWRTFICKQSHLL